MGWRGWCGSLGMRSDEKILETGSRRRDGNSFEERTPFHGRLLEIWERLEAR